MAPKKKVGNDTNSGQQSGGRNPGGGGGGGGTAVTRPGGGGAGVVNGRNVRPSVTPTQTSRNVSAPGTTTNPLLSNADMAYYSGIGAGIDAERAAANAPTPTPAPAPVPTPDSSATTPAETGPTAEMKRIATVMEGMFNSYGLSALYNAALEYVYKGYTDQNWIALEVSKNPAYQDAYYARFPALKIIRDANAKATAEGRWNDVVPEPSPAAYTTLEQGYGNSLKQLGDVGKSMATKENITNWIAGNVAVDEMDRRINYALNYINYSANDAVKQQLRDIYGMTDTEMAAYVLDQAHTEKYLQSQEQLNLRKATVGGAAATAGVNLSQSMRDQISQNEQYGTSFANTNAQFQTIADTKDAYSKLAAVSGQSLTTEELVTDQFGLAGAAEVSQKKKKLSSQERARFEGSNSVNRTSLRAKRLGSQ